MKIAIASHHFPPNYVAGVELHTYRIARWLLRHGHKVRVVCIESVEGASQLHSIPDIYDGIPVYRLYTSLNKSPEPLSLHFWNPDIGRWWGAFLKRWRPDVVHLNSMYLLSASVALVTKELGYPLVLALHDYWILCPLITLLKPDGSLCETPNDAAECAWCLMLLQRRYRLPEIASRQLVGKAVRRVLAHSRMASCLGWQRKIHTICARQNLLRKALSQADAVVVATHFLKNMLVRSGCMRDKVVISPYGLDVSSWNPVKAPAKSPRDSLRIGYIGQIAHQKGVHLLIQAFNQLKHSTRAPELRIYGNPGRFPRYAEWLKRLAAGNPRITFAGTYDNRDTPQVFAGIDVLVVPSIWYEGAPLVITESFATGTPVVAANIGGMAELIRHEINGLVFKAGNVKDLALQLQRLLDDINLLERLRQGIGPVRTMDEEMDQLMGIYRSVLCESVA